MFDYVTIRLPYYEAVHKILFGLYRDCNQCSKNFTYNGCLVKFSLGWLFELPHFPYSDFFSYLSCHKTANDLANLLGTAKDLDHIAIIDQNILYMFCPYLDEIKQLLLTDVSSNASSAKHITPVTTIQSVEDVTKKKLVVRVFRQKY